MRFSTYGPVSSHFSQKDFISKWVIYLFGSKVGIMSTLEDRYPALSTGTIFQYLFPQMSQTSILYLLATKSQHS